MSFFALKCNFGAFLKTRNFCDGGLDQSITLKSITRKNFNRTWNRNFSPNQLGFFWNLKRIATEAHHFFFMKKRCKALANFDRLGHSNLLVRVTPGAGLQWIHCSCKHEEVKKTP